MCPRIVVLYSIHHNGMLNILEESLVGALTAKLQVSVMLGECFPTEKHEIGVKAESCPV